MDARRRPDATGRRQRLESLATLFAHMQPGWSTAAVLVLGTVAGLGAALWARWPGMGRNRTTSAELHDRSQHQAELAELHRVQERYRRMVEQSPDAIWLCEGSRIVMVNRACVALLGAHDDARVLGCDPAVILPGTWASLSESAVAAAGGAVVRECRLLRLDGQARDVEVSAASVPDHGNAAIQLVIRDVSERRRASDALKHQRDELRRLSARLTHAREEERRHLSRELHDELGQQLTAIRIELGALRRDSHGETADRLRELIGHVDMLVGSVRRIAADLRPAMLDDLGLEAALEWLVKEWGERTGLALRLQVHPLREQLSEAAKIAVYRIVQEALTNVARHANARSAIVSLQSQAGHLRIVVADDGVGLSHGAVDKRQSNGLRGIRERARSLGGHAEISNRPGGGSQLVVVLPFERIDSTIGDLQE